MHDPNYEVVNTHIQPFQWGECMLIGGFAFIGLGCSTRGFQLEEAARGAVIMYLEIPFVYLLQWFVFGQSVSWTEISGVALVLVGTIGTAVEKVLIEKRKRLRNLNTKVQIETPIVFPKT